VTILDRSFGWEALLANRIRHGLGRSNWRQNRLNSGLRLVVLDVLATWPCDVGYMRQACVLLTGFSFVIVVLDQVIKKGIFINVPSN